MKTPIAQPPKQIRKYGITERKKAELDQLAYQVLQAQYNVEQQQAIVTSLTAKSATFQQYLASTDKNKSQTLSNKNMMESIVNDTKDLQSNSQVAFDKLVLANSRTKDVAVGMKQLIDRLVYAAEVIDRLSNIVIRQKALNPLISDELVAVIGDAGKDANNAVALALVALKSTFVAQAGALESEASASLEYMQSMQLFEIMTGVDPKGDKSKAADTSLKKLIHDAHHDAVIAHKQADKANKDTIKQLNDAISDLTKAQNTLRSLQAGLAAANAAALAS